MSTPLPHNRNDAERFIDALTGSVDTAVTFQTFREPAIANARFVDPGRIFHGSLAQCWRDLAIWNDRGHAIFVMVNAGDLAGRETANVQSIRAFFIDDDKGLLNYDPNAPDPRFKLPPSMVVRSHGGIHAYFILKEPSTDLAAFTPTQLGLAQHFGTDPKVSDRPRVMRIPGLSWLKAAPFLVAVEYVGSARYTVAEIQAAFPPVAVSAHAVLAAAVPLPGSNPPASSAVVDRARRYISKCPALRDGDGREQMAFKLGAKLTRGFTLSDGQAVDVLKEWAARCTPPLPPSRLPTKIANGRVYGNEPVGGMLINKPRPPATFSSGPTRGPAVNAPKPSGHTG